MRAYAVFSGGGIRGAAHAGCLAAAENLGITFEGYGGVSSGALVAALASVGYGGRELETILATELNGAALFDDGGKRVQRALAVLRDTRQGLDLRRPDSIFKGARALGRGAWAAGVWWRLWADAGLYDLAHVRPTLRNLISRKLGTGQEDVTFGQIHERTGKELRILATDVTRRQAALFSRHHNDYGSSVVEAVLGSMAYPYLYRPLVGRGKARLSDGGLVSNFPAFMFSREHEMTKYPVLAFGLSAEEKIPGAKYNGLVLFADIIKAALGAGDDFFLGQVDGVLNVRVPTAPDVGTLDFGISKGQAKALFDAGFSATSEALGRFELFKNINRRGEELKRELWRTYGEPRLLAPVFAQLVTLIEAHSNAVNLRVHLMLPTGRPDGSRIVAYMYGARTTDADVDLEIAEGEGCSGKAVRTRGMAVVNLLDQDSPLALSPSNHARLPHDRRSLLCAPVLGWRRGQLTQSERPVVAVLSVDSVTSLEDTGWVVKSATQAETDVNEAVVKIMVLMADVIGKLLH